MKLFKKSDHYNDLRFPKTSKQLKYLKEAQEGVNSMWDLAQDFAKEYANQQVENRNVSLAKEMGKTIVA